MGWCSGSSCCHRQLVSRDDRSAVDMAASRPSGERRKSRKSEQVYISFYAFGFKTFFHFVFY